VTENTPSEASAPVVRYTAKELFQRIDEKLDSIDAKLDDKVSRREFDDLKETVTANGGRLEDLTSRVIRLVAAANAIVAAALVAAQHYL
jgi:hypothetical protein